MEAARTAAGRGHEVVLFEKENRLGGNLILAAAAPFKKDMQKYLDWAVRATLNTPNITVRLDTTATVEEIKAENPDSLIIAVGSAPFIPDIPGVEKEKVIWVGDAYFKRGKVGSDVVVAGAGLTGSETALYLAQQGKKVTLIDMLPLEEIDAENAFINIITLRDLLGRYNVKTKAEVMLEAITDAGLVIAGKDQNKTEIPCDTVILSLGLKPRKETVSKFENLVPEVYLVGDCNNLRGNLHRATAEGFNAAMEL